MSSGKTIKNEVAVVSNYATDKLQEVLSAYAKCGYKLVSALMAPNKYEVDVMYLFFTKEIG